MTDPHHRVLEHVPTQLFIGGTWTDAAAGATFPVDDPATGKPLAEVADAGPGDGKAALDAAVAAQPAWAATTPRQRSELLRRAFDEIQACRDDLATLMTLEMGKPLAESHAEIDYGAEFFRWFAEEAVRIDGGYMPSPDGRGRILVTHQPVGPCLLITPWNFPLAMGTRKLGPALAAGCTAVIKPAQQTPLTTLALAAILERAGLPAGVVNVLTTTAAGAVMGPLIEDGRARKLSFTGSTAVGRRLIEQSGARVLRVSMELGGNAPFLVLDDADVDAAVEGAVHAKLRNMGQACTAANRILAAAPIAEAFTRRFAERLASLRVGPGTDPATQVGPLIDEPSRAKVHGLVEDAAARGARILTGGRPLDGDGWFYPPTVLADVPPDAALLGDEIFGPVAPVITFDSDEEAVRLANDTEYGLVAYVFSGDMRRALRVGEALHVGMVGLNRGIVSNAAAPFGGVKESGIGREGGFAGIHEYLDTKCIALDV
jgi:succinate-semialdehyde dehydrogenase / glutarate-semialdehyde dehydrogenase